MRGCGWRYWNLKHSGHPGRSGCSVFDGMVYTIMLEIASLTTNSFAADDLLTCSMLVWVVKGFKTSLISLFARRTRYFSIFFIPNVTSLIGPSRRPTLWQIVTVIKARCRCNRCGERISFPEGKRHTTDAKWVINSRWVEIAITTVNWPAGPESMNS